MKHTQGKWMIAKAGRTQFEVISDKPHRGGRMGDSEDTLICNVAWMETLPEQEIAANAKLIAAAPELLEAVKEVMDAVRPETVELDNRRVGSKGIPSDEAICKALEAIKKATE